MRLTHFYKRKETKLTTPDYSHQAIISGLRAEIDGKDKIIEAYQKQVQELNDKGNRNFALYSDLQYAIRYFFEQNRNDDEFEFDIDAVNTFLAENSIEPLKREYRVSFSIEGVVIVEAENEEEASAIVDELDVSHYTADIEYFNAEATSVDTQF